MPITYKKCAQCGCVLPEDAYKIKYVSKKTGKISRNRFCRNCEEDTRRYNELLAKGDSITAEESILAAEYVKAFSRLERQGLSTPLSRCKVTKHGRTSLMERTGMLELLGILDTEEPATNTDSTVPLSKEATQQKDMSVDTLPDDLRQWLKEPASGALFEQWRDKRKFTPEYLNDVVYPALKAAYRPETGWNNETMSPIYDDSYKSTLNDISNLFWAYEDWCIAQKLQESKVTAEGDESNV